MLRLPPYRYHRPTRLEAALELLATHAGEAMPLAGGTDLVPNMKHRLFEPAHVVALGGLPELRGIREEDGHLVLGAGETLASVAESPLVRTHVPALADAAGHVAGPQLRNRGTLGGNVCLDTRCTYYNQTAFWRGALGYCLKKDGDVCHVTKVGKKCVAAHSADTPPVLMTVGAELEIAAPDGRRTIPIEDFFVADGIHNTRLEPGEILTSVRVPIPEAGTRTAYAKLRQRRSIDFPLLTVAIAGDFEEDGTVRGLRGVVTALGSRPKTLARWEDEALGERLTDEVIDALAERAFKQCHPLENLIADPEWRRAMVPVYVRKALDRIRVA